MIAATIVARNYLAQARVLASSFVEHHPEARFVALVIDGDASDGAGSGGPEVLLPRDLGLPSEDWEQMAGAYSVLELATALKPALLRHLLAGDASDHDGNPTVLYLDPDIMVYKPFPEVFAAARRSGIALTPHVLHPLPRDGLEPNERCLMLSGLFNLGFICVGSGASAFLDWWYERLLLDAVIDFPNALFTDQRWVDWVPSLFGGEVLRDHGLNVAYWNLHERPLARGGDGRIMAAGEPLKFFHFSGYEPDQPRTLSKHAAGHPRCPLENDPLVMQLCSDYVAALAKAGFDQTRHLPYGLACAPNGLVLTPVVRAAYRSGIKAALDSGATLPPSPFFAGGDAFCTWLMAPAVGPPELELGSWHLQLWRQRPDLQAAFPDIGGCDGKRFREWLDNAPEAQQLQDQLGPACRSVGRNGSRTVHPR